MRHTTSIFERLLSRPRSIWVSLGASLLLLSLPFLAAALDGIFDEFIRLGGWRVPLLPPTIVAYIWVVSPLIERSSAGVLSALRPLVDRDDEEFDRLVEHASRTNPANQWLAFTFGAMLGFIAARSGGFEAFSWLAVYWHLSVTVMYGLLAWTIFASFVYTRMNATLHREKLHFDVLDPSPFEPVGRQSLLLALVFIGGITISFVLTFQPGNLIEPVFWFANLLLILFALFIFFLSMRPTHQVLLESKKRLLEPVQAHIRAACRDLVECLEQENDPGDFPARINALETYERRLQAARTWPYDTATLRTLFFSIFIPLISVLGRVAAEVWVR